MQTAPVLKTGSPAALLFAPWRLGRPFPDSQRTMAGKRFEIRIGREHGQLMPDAELGQKSVDCPDLCPAAPTAISQFSSSDVILAIGNQKGYGGKPVQDFPAGLWA